MSKIESIELRDLALFWRGRAKALRAIHIVQPLSDATLATAETYEKCADEIKAALVGAIRIKPSEKAAVFIAPHERYEAIEAYRDRLTLEQIDEVTEAPDGAIIHLRFGGGGVGTHITIFEEG